MNLAQWLNSTALAWPELPALLTGTKVKANYREFAHRAASFATALRKFYDVQPGCRVGIYMKNSTEYLEAMYGVWWAGGVVVPINAKLHENEAAYIIDHSNSKVTFINQSSKNTLTTTLSSKGSYSNLLCIEEQTYQDCLKCEPMLEPTPRKNSDLSWLFYTSGTTGKPKGVMLSNQNLIAMSTSYTVDVDSVLSEDCALYSAPISHGAGMYNFIHVRQGARHVIPPSGGFDPEEILSLAKQLQNISMFAAPTMVKRLVDTCKSSGKTGEGIKTIVYGGGPMYLADIIEAVDIMGAKFVQIYGQGESPMTITALDRKTILDRSHPEWKSRLTSVGRAQSCVEVQIFDKNNQKLPANSDGEIAVRGPQVMQGYWQNSEATKEAFYNEWLLTGDIGRLDQSRFLTLTDRSKDLIISGGTNIYPREVEEVLLLMPSISEVSVVGRPHQDWGEEVVAFVVLKQGCNWDPLAMDKFCLEQMARFKRPKAFFKMESLPKNNYGKVLKTELRELLKKMENKKNNK